LLGHAGSILDQLEEHSGLGIGVGDALGLVLLGCLQQILWPGVFSMDFACLLGPLGEAAVLAEIAGQIAAHGAYGQTQTTWMEVKQGLFFYGIQIYSSHLIINQGLQLLVLIDPNPAFAVFISFQQAKMIA
jgi:hypothetical protein